MGIDTKALLTKAPGIVELMHWADDNYKNASARPTIPEKMYWLNFRDGNDDRHLSVFVDGECSCDYRDFYTGDATLISMGCWGNSEIIARKLVADFGGWFMVNDCKDEWTRLDQDMKGN